jgi:hypothetical protein
MAAAAMAFPQGGIPIPQLGKDGHYGKEHYFQYINVPAPKTFEWGYRRGNDPEHFREEYLSQNDHSFKAKLRWGDAYEGHGEQFYDYNHAPKYAPEKPVYSPPVPAYNTVHN